MSNARDTYDGSAAQSQHFAAAETLVEHAQLPRTGASSSTRSFAPQSEHKFPHPLGPLTPAQYPHLPPVLQGPFQDGQRRSSDELRMPEFVGPESPYSRPPTILHPDHQFTQHGTGPASNTYGNPPHTSGAKSMSSRPQRSPERASASKYDTDALTTVVSSLYDKGRPKREENSKEHPIWAELKTKAGKERKRLPLACIACRRKKIRCSGEKPACKHCLRSRNPCIYKFSTRKVAFGTRARFE